MTVIVKRSQQIVKDRMILNYSWEDTIGSLLLSLGNDLEAETIYQAVISNNDKFVDPRHNTEIMIFMVFSFFCLAPGSPYTSELSEKHKIKLQCRAGASVFQVVRLAS